MMVKPTLLAALGDLAHPEWRASPVGVYRLWRDEGCIAGTLLAVNLANLLDPIWTIGVVAALTFISGVVVATTMHETLGARRISLASPAERTTELEVLA